MQKVRLCGTSGRKVLATPSPTNEDSSPWDFTFSSDNIRTDEIYAIQFDKHSKDNNFSVFYATTNMIRVLHKESSESAANTFHLSLGRETYRFSGTSCSSHGG